MAHRTSGESPASSPQLEPIQLQAHGRGDFLAFLHTLDGELAQVRVSDTRQPAFWLQLIFTREQLEEALRQMEAAEEGGAP
jgi:hypothetical protein